MGPVFSATSEECLSWDWVSLCTKYSLASHCNRDPVTGPLLVSPWSGQSPGLERWGYEVSWKDSDSLSKDRLKQFPRSRVCWVDSQSLSGGLPTTLSGRPFRGFSFYRIFLIWCSCLSLWFWINNSSSVKLFLFLSVPPWLIYLNFDQISRFLSDVTSLERIPTASFFLKQFLPPLGRYNFLFTLLSFLVLIIICLHVLQSLFLQVVGYAGLCLSYAGPNTVASTL